jgi:hypothetical protein
MSFMIRRRGAPPTEQARERHPRPAAGHDFALRRSVRINALDTHYYRDIGYVECGDTRHCWFPS